MLRAPPIYGRLNSRANEDDNKPFGKLAGGMGENEWLSTFWIRISI